jgi:hypothetical protein
MTSFTTMHNDHLDPDKHGDQEPPEWYMEGQKVVFDFFSCDENESESAQIAHCEKWAYKSTNCGAWIEFTPTGIVLGSIVEGCDFGTATYILNYVDKFTAKDIQDRIDAIEAEADAIWEWSNRPCDKNGKWRKNGAHTMAELGLDAPDIDCNYRMFQQGERSS